MRAIYVMWKRQVTRSLRSRARIIGALGQPVLFLIALGFGFGPIYERAGGGNYIDFLAPGIIAMSILFTSVFSGIEMIWDKQFGFLKETLVAPVPRMHIVLGRILGGATIATLQGVIVLGISMIAGFHPLIAAIPFSIVFMFLIAVIFGSLGTCIASRIDDMQGFQLIMNFIVMPIFFLSGALFPLDGLNNGIAMAARFNPLSYGVDAVRGTLTGVEHYGLFIDSIVLIVIAAILVGIATYLFSKIQL